MSETPRAFPTIERIAATPLNETFHYQGYQLYSEARALWLIYQDTLSALTAAQAKLAEVEAKQDALKEDAERYRLLRSPDVGVEILAKLARNAYADERFDAVVDAARKK